MFLQAPNRSQAIAWISSVFVFILLQGMALGAEDPCTGFTLFAPNSSNTTYLINNDEQIIHTWPSTYKPGLAVYLLDNGNILRTMHLTDNAGGSGGGFQEIDWNGNLQWEFQYSNSSHLQHHDIEPLPNGNVLIIAWEYKTQAEAIAAGRNPNLLKTGLFYSEEIVEVEPSGSSGGQIVWEWHLWDHLIQDYDSNQSNYGVVADHPELVDINFPNQKANDWIHFNSVDYNEELDQVLVSSRLLSEIWVIDHSTTMAEAAGHSGGNSGKGGDLLYRWGNPQAYDAGSSTDQQLYNQHDAQWIAPGRPGEGNILIFNNGCNRPGGNYSSVDEIVPPVDAVGNYSYTPGSAYEPVAASWSYTATNPSSFYSARMGGAERLLNGNTLICNANSGHFFEVNDDMEILWEYVNSYPSSNQKDVFKIRRYEHHLWSDTHTLSSGSGGTIEFALEADTPNADRKYLLVAGVSGTTPGTSLPGGLVTLPINWDWFSDLQMSLLGTSLFSGFVGLLDGQGKGSAQLNVPTLTGAAGITLYFAYCCNNPFDFVSNAVEIEIVE